MQVSNYGDSHGIFINGAFGAGKSTVLDLIGDRLAQAQLPFSLMDVDWFHRSSPTASDDPDNVLTEARNIAAVWSNYLEAGPRIAVLSGVITSADARRRYEVALGRRLHVVCLSVSKRIAFERLERRYGGRQPEALAWHRNHWALTASAIERSSENDFIIEADDHSSSQVADMILDYSNRVGLT